MAFFKGSIRSQTLGMDTGLTVVLPFDRAAVPETECPAIYLLHGHGENADVWTRMTSAERYANAYGVALVMPEVQRSFIPTWPWAFLILPMLPRNCPLPVSVCFTSAAAGRTVL